MASNFSLYSKYYDLLYADKDYPAEAGYVTGLLKQHASSAKTILEFGSGTGRHGRELMNNGNYEVYGLERSETMVAEAKRNGFPCEVADITSFELNRKFDAVVSLFHVISYITGNEDLIRCFENAHRHLNGGGVFIFDAWYSPAVFYQKAVPRVKKMEDKEVLVTRIAEPVEHVNENVIDVRYTVYGKDKNTGEVSELFESHPMRHFSLPEVGLLARHCGFRVLKAEEFLTGKNPGTDTWGVCFILMKK